MASKLPIDLARAAKDRAKTVLSKVPGVVGLGLTKVDDQYAVKVNLEAALPKSLTVPNNIDGVPVMYEVVGRIKAQ